MRSIQLVLALIRIPRLFMTLILFPLAISLVIIYLQLFTTGLFTKAITSNNSRMKEWVVASSENNILRQLIFGRGAPLPSPRICRWKLMEVDGAPIELPPESSCNPDRLDAALRVKEPSLYDPTEYARILDGNYERLHLCRTCQPDLVLHVEESRPRAEIRSLWALGLLSLSQAGGAVAESKIVVLRRNEVMADRIGQRSLHLPGFRSAVTLENLAAMFMLILNMAFLVIIALWLCLKAHRRVLEYFARNGALLPLVAACGKQSFYAAIWIVTLLRVSAFLIGALPAVIFCTAQFMPEDELAGILARDVPELLLWLIALVASLALSGMVGSIADLKQRHHLLSFAYRFIPLTICGLGSILWIATLIIEGGSFQILRNIIASLPIAGMTPMLMAPVFRPHVDVLAVHALAASLLFFITLKRNANWFAAHLEDL